MTLTQTVDIPVSRRLHLDFDVPRDVMANKAHITIQFHVQNETYTENFPKKALPKGKIGMSKKELDNYLKNAHTPITDSLIGILHTDMTVDEIRTKRLAKHI